MKLRRFGLTSLLLASFAFNPFNLETLAEHKKEIQSKPTSIAFSPRIEDKRGKLPTNTPNPSQKSCNGKKRIYEKNSGIKKNILLYDRENLVITNLTNNMKGNSIDPKINCYGNEVFFKNNGHLYYINLNQNTKEKEIIPISRGEEVRKYLINEKGDIIIYEAIPKKTYEGERCVLNIFLAVPKKKFSENLTTGEMRKELIDITPDGKRANYWIYLIETPTELRRAQRTATLDVIIAQAYENSRY